MASASNSCVPSETLVSIICSVCTDRLLKDNGSGQVVTICGHVFHKKCLSDWYRSQDLYECPKCRNTTESDSSSSLFLDGEEDSDYLAILKTVEYLREGKAEALKELEQLYLRLDDETKKLYRLRQEKAEVAEYAASLNLENVDLKKQMTVAKIKEILLGPNKQLLDDQFGQLKWDDLTVSFQNELLDTISPRCRAILNIVPFRSDTLIHLIRSGPNEFLLRLIEEEYNQQLQLNGSVSWNDFKLFNQDLLPRLSEKCGFWDEVNERSELELNQFPLTPKIIVTLMKDEEDDTHSGATLLASIVELFIENLSDVQIKNICKILLMQLIIDKIPNQLELRFPFVEDQDELLELVRFGILKETANFDFVYDSVKYFFLEMLKRRMEEVKSFRRNDNEHFAFADLKNYFFIYFANNPSDRSIYLSKLIDFKEEKFADLLMIFAVMSSERCTKDVQRYMNNTIDYNMKTREWPCRLKSSPINLTLIHFAAIKGDYITAKFLLFDHAFYRELDHPRYEKLVQVCVLETLNNSSMEILERKLILTSILEHSNVAALSQSSIRLTNVHIDLLKFLMERGGRVPQMVWRRDEILLEAAEYLEPHQFHYLVYWLNSQCRVMLRKKDATGASALDLALQRINVKPETVQIFRDAGITLKDQDDDEDEKSEEEDERGNEGEEDG